MFSLAISSCTKKVPEDKAAILVNDYTLSADEFNDLLDDSGIAKDEPKQKQAFLDNLITRKLILQQAQKEGLDKEGDFLKSIERFWEQSLLKIVIDKKISEAANNIEVTEQDIASYYKDWVKLNPENPKILDDLRDPIRKRLLNKKQTGLIDSWIETLKKDATIKVDKKAIGIE